MDISEKQDKGLRVNSFFFFELEVVGDGFLCIHRVMIYFNFSENERFCLFFFFNFLFVVDDDEVVCKWFCWRWWWWFCSCCCFERYFGDKGGEGMMGWMLGNDKDDWDAFFNEDEDDITNEVEDAIDADTDADDEVEDNNIDANQGCDLICFIFIRSFGSFANNLFSKSNNTGSSRCSCCCNWVGKVKGWIGINSNNSYSVAAKKGHKPKIKQYKVTPKDQISKAFVGGNKEWRHNSGAKNAGVPTVSINSLGSSTFWSKLTPKSLIFTTWSLVNNKLAGLISRWMIPISCTIRKKKKYKIENIDI